MSTKPRSRATKLWAFGSSRCSRADTLNLEVDGRGLACTAAVRASVNVGAKSELGQTPVPVHHIFAVVTLGHIHVVRGTHHLDVLWPMVAATAKSHPLAHSGV